MLPLPPCVAPPEAAPDALPGPSAPAGEEADPPVAPDGAAALAGPLWPGAALDVELAALLADEAEEGPGAAALLAADAAPVAVEEEEAAVEDEAAADVEAAVEVAAVAEFAAAVAVAAAVEFAVAVEGAAVVELAEDEAAAALAAAAAEAALAADPPGAVPLLTLKPEGPEVVADKPAATLAAWVGVETPTTPRCTETVDPVLSECTPKIVPLTTAARKGVCTEKCFTFSTLASTPTVPKYSRTVVKR